MKVPYLSQKLFDGLQVGLIGKLTACSLFMIPITQNYQGISFAPKHGDASHI